MFAKSKPKEIVYRNYRNGYETNFNRNLHNQLSSEPPKDNASFEKIFSSILEELAPLN